LETNWTFACDSSDSVATASIATKVEHCPALINILAVSVRSQGEAVVAQTSVAAGVVDTGSIATDIVATITLIDVNTLVTRGAESVAWWTDALEAASIVAALTIGAHSSHLMTLIDVPAVSASDVQSVAMWTGAIEAALSVGALCQT